jgi:MerR family mercuric resistance operon transcriptional regulator
MNKNNRLFQGMAIGELARETGVNIETIRYYERVGLLPAPARTSGGRRLYETEQARRLSFIRNARMLGFTIEDVRSLLALLKAGEGVDVEARALTERHLAQVRRKIAELRKLEGELKRMVAACKPGEQAACPIVASLSSG